MAKKQSQKRITRQRPTQEGKIPTWVWFAVSGVVAVLLVALLFYLGNRGSVANPSIEGLEFFGDPCAGHVEGDINYQDTLPVAFKDIPPGGIHNSAWQNCGIYDGPVRAENAVHSLEHGAVWIAYRSDLPENQVETLRELTRQERRNQGEAMIVLSPQEALSDPIVLTAWRVQLRVNDASDSRIADFVSTYQRGPFTPEPGAACNNGVGEPLS
jgi:hypothetical protein